MAPRYFFRSFGLANLKLTPLLHQRGQQQRIVQPHTAQTYNIYLRNVNWHALGGDNEGRRLMFLLAVGWWHDQNYTC